MKITQQQVVTAALALVDKEGLDKLNMRALANRLGCSLRRYIGM